VYTAIHLHAQSKNPVLNPCTFHLDNIYSGH
jgi:hypothetical protein